MTAMTDEPLYDVQAVAKLLSISQRTVWRLVSEGKLQRIQISAKIVRFAPAEVRMLMAPQTEIKVGGSR